VGLLARAFSLRSNPPAGGVENPANPLNGTNVLDFMGGGPSKAGVSVTQESASRLTAFWCGTRILSETVASVPLCIYEREGRGRRKATEHPLYPLLHDEPNPEMSSFFVRECMQAQIVYHGNGYAVIRRDKGGRIRELWPLISQRVEPKRAEDGSRVYAVTMRDGTHETWGAEEVLHVPGLSFDGVKGRSVIGAARDAIGGALVVQDYSATFFKHGARPPGVVETQLTKLDPESKKNLQETWLSGRGDNWHQVVFLPRNMKYQAAGVPPDDAQFLETRKFGIVEMARILNIPVHFLKDLERATFANIEHQSLEFVVYTMRPIYVRWEQELNRKLLTPEERGRYYIAFNMDALLRGDTAAQTNAFSAGRQWGWYSANDVCELQDRPGIGPGGDIYMVPINMIPADQVLDGGGSGAPPPPAPAAGARARQLLEQRRVRQNRSLRLRRRIRSAQRPIIEDRAGQIVKREIGAIEKELKDVAGDGRSRRSVAPLRRAIDDFYDGHAGWAARRMQPVIVAYAGLIDPAIAQELGNDPPEEMTPELEKFSVDYAKHFGRREASEGRLQLLALVDEYEAEGDEAVAEAIQQRLDEWGEKRAGKIAGIESVRFMAAAAKVLYVAAGVSVLRWVANGTACDFCKEMDGKTAGVEQNFVNAGQGVDGGEDAGPPMKPSDNIGHPPLHDTCECDVVAD
jgi:HK97 family phage portal protein